MIEHVTSEGGGLQLNPPPFCTTDTHCDNLLLAFKKIHMQRNYIKIPDKL